MIDLIIEAERIVTPAGVRRDGAALVRHGRVIAVGVPREVNSLADVRADVLRGEVLLPGFIDLHWHGYGGHRLDDGPEQARAAVRAVAASGVTTVYAGLGAGATLDAIAATVAGAAAVVDSDTGGARLAGLFLEGPFISPEKKGAWNAAHLRLPSVAEAERLSAAANGTLRRVNVAPELPGAPAFIRWCVEQGIVVSLGHSNATYEQALAAVEMGAAISNHTFNAMSGLDHRSPGLAGAALSSDGLLAELILDRVHVHPAAARALYRARGAAGVALITDGSALTGMADGTYYQLGRTVAVAGGACRLPDGTLAGSTSPFDRNLRHAREDLTADLVALAAMTSGNAARAMGLDSHTGRIAPGMEADLVLLDAELNVRATVVRGVVVYRAGTEA